jgi:hypothetical protein
MEGKMKKFAVITVLGLALLLMGLTLSASAVTISTPWSPDGPNGAGELNLYQVFNNVNFANSTFTAATFNADAGTALLPILETLPVTDGISNFHYTVDAVYATYAGFTHTPGWYLAGTPGTSGAFGFTATTDGIITLPGGPIAFAPTGAFGFYDLTSDGVAGTKYTERTLNPSYGSQSNGFIFDLKNGSYIVAFEDGSDNQPFGDSDYNDLVFKITVTSTPVPLPPSALLMGSGLLGLVGLGWRRRKTNV